MRLIDDFYNQHGVDVARSLLGKKLIWENFEGIITETEAYRGYDDEASHAFRGKTKRSEIMFGPAGYAYVYMIYGMYYCFNIVTEEAGQASAVLIRGLKLPDTNLNGPGKLCKYLGINKIHNGVNLIKSENMYLTNGLEVKNYFTSSRIGIKKATDKLWRFYI